MKRIYKIIGIMMLASALVASLTGCRISPALIDTVYTADAEDIDPNPTAREFTDDGEEDNDALQDREDDTAEDQNLEEDRAQAEQENSEEDDAAYQEVGDSYTEKNTDNPSHTGDAGNSDSVAGNSDDTSGGSGGSGGISNEADGDDTGNTITDTDDFEDILDNTGDTGVDSSGNDSESDGTDNSNETNEDSSGGAAIEDDAPIKDVPKKVVTDASGTEQEIPEDVYTVTAVGAAAPIVAMVGGVGRLMATSESFVSNDLGSIIIENCSDAEISIWWSGEGSEGISDENFEALLQASPDVCFEISGEATFSSAQITKLQEHGIGYLVLPELSSGENLKDAVMIVAEALVTNEDTGQSAVTIANEYGDWVDECLADAADYRKTLDYYTLYISEWREDVTFTRRYDPGLVTTYEEYMIVDFPSSSGVVNGTGSGVAVAKREGEMFNEFWEAAGIESLTTKTLHWGYDREYVFPYESWFGIPEFSDQSVFYFTDYLDAHQDYFAGSTKSYLVDSSGILGPNTLTFGNSGGEMADPYYHLGGSERFSAIVVADEETKEAISNSPQWKAGFLDDTSSEVYNISLRGRAIDIAGDYEIYVNPTGFDNWAEGSVDSPLEAYWILYKISGGINYQQLRNKVRAFYSDFYGIDLPTTQINNMVNQ